MTDPVEDVLEETNPTVPSTAVEELSGVAVQRGMSVRGTTRPPLVSAIVPTHNRAHCLPRALDSIYAQEGRGELFEIEVIVVDDASSDATPDVVRRYSNVRYIRLAARRGVTPARNAGLRASTGVYISFLDDDDVWLPHKLRTQVPEIEAHPDVGLVYSQALIRRGEEEELHPAATRARSGWVFEAMLLDAFCSHHASTLIRRTAFDRVGDFDECLGSYEDYDLSLRIAVHFPLLFKPGAVDVYNLSPRGLWLSRAANGLGAQDASRVIEKALHTLPESTESTELKRAARARVALSGVHPFLEMGDSERTWAQVTAVLETCPDVVNYEWARNELSWAAYTRARDAASPLAATRALCSEIKATGAGRGRRHQVRIRQIVAMTWAQMALSLAVGRRGNNRHAVYAAAQALVHAPLYLLRRGVQRRFRAGDLRGEAYRRAKGGTRGLKGV